MIDAVLGIDVSKNTFDTNLGAGTKARSKSFANSPDGWHHLIAWLGEYKIGQVHACLEATGRHGLGIAHSMRRGTS
jgi:transposase